MHDNCHQLRECLSPAATVWKGSDTFVKTLTSCTSGYLYLNDLISFHHTCSVRVNLVESN